MLCYGDSNTHGTLPMADLDDRRRLGPGERWPGIMATALGPSWRVVEEGLPGRTTVHDDPVEGTHLNGLAALPVALGTHRPVDVVALMLGTNDMKARFAVVPEDVAASVDRLVAGVRGSGAGPAGEAPRILLIAPPPILEAGCLAPFFAGGAAKSQQLGRALATLARRRGVAFLDAGTVIRSSPVDGIHLDAEAHAALGRAVAEAMRALG